MTSRPCARGEAQVMQILTRLFWCAALGWPLYQLGRWLQ